MTIIPSPLDGTSATIRRASILLEAYKRDILQEGALQVIEPAYKSYKALAERIDDVFSKEKDPDFLLEYAGRMKYCSKQFKQLEEDISKLKNGELINPGRSIAALAYLGGELTGMKYTLDSIVQE